MRRYPVGWVFLVTISSVIGCANDGLTPVVGCAWVDDFEVDCQFQNPEDLARSPDGRILVSQFGGMDGGRAGNIAAYDPRSKELEILFPNDSEMVRSWGEASCAAPSLEKFSPHGIDIQLRRDGLTQLAVVNHGGRESVELFEVSANGSIVWRGCVEAPEHAFLNDIVVLEDGGFWVTHMFEHGHDMRAMLAAGFGIDTGWIYSWSAEGGFAKLPGTDAPFPNGIEKSADEHFVYMNMYAATGVRKIDVRTGEVVASIALPNVDNSTWAEDGRLLVASHTASLGQMMACQELTEGACGMPFEILSLDPDDLSSRVWIRHEGPPMGGATVALEIDGVVYLGSFAGDRIGRVKRPKGGDS